MCKSMYREKETNGKRKKEGVYARLKQYAMEKSSDEKILWPPSRFSIFANVFNNFNDFHNTES